MASSSVFAPSASFGGSSKPDAHDLRLAGEGRAAFVGVVAERDHVVECHHRQVRHDLRFVLVDVHPGFGHGLYRQRIEAMPLDSGRIRFDDITLQVARPALGHLAAAGIASAEEQYLYLPLCLRHSSSGSILRICLRRWASSFASLVRRMCFRAQSSASLASGGASSPARRK